MVRFENVGMRYGQADEVLRDISFTLEPGSFTFVTGPSGAGKSSLLKLLYLAHRPSRGLIELFGHDLSQVPRNDLPGFRRRIGVVFQEFRLLEHLSAYDNVALPLRVAGQSDAQARENVVELLNWVGLGERLRARPSALSGGEKQRLAIARAVINRPELLIADEPTASVDPEMGERLMHLFVELNRIGTTIVLATHDAALINRYDTRVLRLDEGELVGPRLRGARPLGARAAGQPPALAAVEDVPDIPPPPNPEQSAERAERTDGGLS
ncbi:cell division ATP-binding protein FtsE [Zavarzinia sp. CC-PAN008]|uniref:cell division ATP-binding protein FtsE n=1 Tax=Zavarzinia sp. CC-PAN008 TaxID=3243332 RepID=UPI003F743A6A